MSDARNPQFTAEQLAEVRRLQGLYPDRRGALLPVLHLAQDTFGYISLEVEEYVGGLFELSPAHGHVVSVCHNISCYLMNAKGIIQHVGERLGIEPGETTPDGRVTFLTVECLCACEQAPMMQVDERYEGNLTNEKVDRILDGLR